MRKFAYGLLLVAATFIPALPASAQYYSSSYYGTYVSPYTYTSPYTYNTNAYTYTNPYTYTSPYRYRTNTFGAVYPYYSDYPAKRAAADSLIQQVNSAISAGQITVEQGNAILIRGSW